MVKADWLQSGDSVQNPYMGQKMPDCGEVRKKLPAPAPGSEISGLVSSYLAAASALAGDRIDPEAMKALRSEAEKLPSEQLGTLKDAATKFADSGDLKSARSAFKALSRELMAALEQATK